MLEVLSSFSYIQLVKLAPMVPVQVSKFVFSTLSEFGFSLFFSYFQVFHCVFIDFFKGCIYFLFKDLYCIHNGCFKVFSLCFSYDGLLRARCSRAAGPNADILSWLSLCFHAGVWGSGLEEIVVLGADIWTCLCWVFVPWFLLNLWLLGESGGCVLLDRKYAGPDWCGYWGLQIKMCF